MGLKQKLTEWIKSENGKIIYIDAIEKQVKLWGYKVSNYERRLRDSESPEIGKLMKNGAIIGYFWRKGEHLAENAPVEPQNAPRAEISENVAKILASWQKPVETPKLTLF